MMKKMSAHLTLTIFLIALCFAPLFAQEQTAEKQEKDYGIRIISVDPSLTGETGIIATLVADTLPKGEWAYGFSYYNWDRELTDFDVNQFALSIAFGILDNLEVSASMVAFEQIKFTQAPSAAIFPPRALTAYPFPIRTIEEGIGALYIGAKYSFLQDSADSPGVAIRGFVKVPTGDEEEGFGSGATDFGGDLILSKHMGDSLLLTANLGITVLGTPDVYSDYSFGNDIRWGFGGKYFVDKNFRLMGELTGVNAMDDDDFPQEDIIDMRVGAEYKWESGMRLTAGYTRTLMFDEPSEDPNGAFLAFTWSPWRGMKELREAERRDAEERERIAQEETRQREEAERKRVEEEKKRAEEESAKKAAEQKAAQEAAKKAAEEAANKAAAEEAAKKAAEEEAAKKAVAGLTDIYFAFDRSDLRESEVEKLNAVVNWLKENPLRNVTIEGHCCYIGTDEYNLALGEARANAIRSYLIGQGIADTRLGVISYGESQPAFDNSTEATRKFNRRGHFTLKIN
jgi:peptidoglycan-associated lipoprotein